MNVSGAVNDSSTAYHFGAASNTAAAMSGSTYLGQYVSIPSTSDFSLTKGSDNFNRSAALSPSWGTPSTGSSNWAWISTSGNYYGVTTTGVGSSTVPGAYIDQTSTTGTYGQGFPAQTRLDTDVQLDVSWVNSGFANTTSGTYQPLLLTARFADTSNFYAARVTEANGTINLAIVKRQSGASSTLATVTLASTYDYTVQWRVRFQIESDRSVSPPAPVLRAKAWKVTDQQPLTWLSSTDPGTPLAAGGNGIMSSNSGSNNHSYVTFDNYRLQSAGLTVSTWIRPTTESFTNPSGSLCGGNTDANYVNYVGKSGYVGSTSQAEWHLRHYPQTSIDTACSGGGTDDRRSALSAYAFSLAPTTSNPSNKGAGDRFNPPSSLVGWHHVVGLYDPGDSTDRAAGVTICVDGTCYPKTYNDGGPGVGANYSDPSYLVDPMAGTSPLRVGAGYGGSAWQQFQGDIDELSIYEYRLTTQNIADMYSYKL